MEDVKDKVKGFISKVNSPFSSSSSSSSGRFKGQGRVLGSSDNPPPPNPPNRPIRTYRTPISAPRSDLDPERRDLPTNGLDPFAPLITSGQKVADLRLKDRFECPVCGKVFASEEAAVDHVELCLEEGEGGDMNEGAVVYLSGEPPESSVEVVVRLLGNVVKEPENAKFRRVRMGNPKIKEAIGDVAGALGVLECVGFRIVEEEGETWAVMAVPSEEELVRIREVIALLEKGKTGSGNKAAVVLAADGEGEKRTGEVKKIDRKVRVFSPVPGSVAEQMDLPDSFYNLSAQELKREVESRKKKIAESQLLIPKSYKEKQMKAARKKYKSTVIRIQFPDGVVIQGFFLPWELTSALYKFVCSALKEPALEFELLLPALHKPRVIPHSSRPGVKAPTLEEEELVPSALVKFKTKETDSLPFTGLRNELLEVSEPLTAAVSAADG